MEERMQELLAKHNAGALKRKEREELHRLLEAKYPSPKGEGPAYGTVLEEYLCLNCGRPMRLTYEWGPYCPPLDGNGCGKPFSYRPKSRTRTRGAGRLPMQWTDELRM